MTPGHLQDASDEFNAIHSSKAKAQLDDFLLGELTTDGIPPAGAGLKPSHAALKYRTLRTGPCVPSAISDPKRELQMPPAAAAPVHRVDEVQHRSLG